MYGRIVVMIIAVLVVFGLAFGSFVNAWVWRVHQQSLPKKKRAASDKELSIARGRSMCPHCKHTLAWYDLLPVISWLALRGKCRYCHKAVSRQYPAVELVTVALFVVSYLFWPQDLAPQSSVFSLQSSVFVLWLASLVCLMALFVYDVRWMLLPNRIVLPLTVVAGLSAIVTVIAADNPFIAILKVVGAIAIASGVFYVLFQVSAGRWIGGGDVKLGFALGLLLAKPELAFVMIFLASVIGIIAALPSLLKGKGNMQSKMPFGPCLIAATVVMVLFGDRIVTWYASTFLYM